MSWKKIWLAGLLLLAFAINITAVALFKFYNDPVIHTSSCKYYLLQPGMPLKKIAKDLVNKHILTSDLTFTWYARVLDKAHKIQSGEYCFAPGSTSADILRTMIDGRVIEHAVTLIDGQTFAEWRNTLNHTPKLLHLTKNMHTTDIAAQLALTNSDPEGLFAADTYHFVAGSSDIGILKRAHQNLMQKLAQLWQQRDTNLGYKSPYQALIVASIIEKETSSDNERAIIADIILRRLAKGMRLQMDPTVIYGLANKYQGKLSKADLRLDTAYNTYKHKGLPPTPIAMPSLDSLYAALHPEPNPYWYFVAKGDGTHVFSINLQQQRAAIKKYILDKKNQRQAEVNLQTACYIPATSLLNLMFIG